MSKQTVFKKVMVTDRLPNKRTYVATINTLGGIDTLYHIGNGEFTNSHVSIDTLHYIESWLEEIELPSEEEVTEAYINHKGHINNPALFGANYILNKLK